VAVDRQNSNESVRDYPVLRLQAHGLGLRQYRRVYDLEVNVSENYDVGTVEAVYQLTNAVLALANVLAKAEPELTKGYLAIAIEGSRLGGHGDALVKEIFQKAFPGQPIPPARPPSDFTPKK
jgi:hypothetical protein